jgi:hypothetical protein
MSTNAARARTGTAGSPSRLVSDEVGSTAAHRLTSRIGAVLFLLGLVVVVISTQLHPAHENPMDNSAVFREYAQSDRWIAVHLGQFAGFLLVIGGLVALYFSIAIRPDAAAAVARFGVAAAITTGASFTILQAVDGVALKRAVDAWASAPSDQQAAAFAAAEAIRWIEIGVNSLSFSLVGLTLVIYGVALALSNDYPADWLAGRGRRNRAPHPRRRSELPRLCPLDCRADRVGASGLVDGGHGGLDVAPEQSATRPRPALTIGVGARSCAIRYQSAIKSLRSRVDQGVGATGAPIL